jgi:hypothetical protein
MLEHRANIIDCADLVEPLSHERNSISWMEIDRQTDRGFRKFLRLQAVIF